ncbi:uncharacterized protein LOC129985239 [Argiope bruennichi]|uniref:Uncharacterized protein n=1 Tax=Argiope bruennichi TaxID=94029 RepID=A0A8T0EJC6_ARGBR|nr:uncharacterized protein LOC129985239 [Argiope bruennichi]KAF8773678.1 hypothetical protein HNY73_016315 [Argiope bruennichi]
MAADFTSTILSDDILIVEKEDIKNVEEGVPLIFEVGDGKISVVEELVTSGESLESISPASTREDDIEQEIEEELANNLTTIRRVYFQPEFISTDFVRKVWTAFLTFHVFVIPAIIGMILSVVTRLGIPELNDPYQDIKYSVMIGFLGSSVLVGLPFHMLALADLEDTVNDVMLQAQTDGSERNTNRESSIHSDSDDTLDSPPYF